MKALGFMNIHIIRTGFFRVNTLVVPLNDKACFVVDPAGCKLSGDSTAVTNYLKNKKLECRGIILTHSHFDHITGIAPVKEAFPAAKIAIHKSEINELINPPGPMNNSVIRFFGELTLLNAVAGQPPADVALYEGATLEDVVGEGLGGEDWHVLSTPGHTPGSICIYNPVQKVLISGDTLFAYGGYGRTDMAGGDEATIMKSLSRLRKEIPAGTHVFPGHDEDFIKED